MTKQAPQKTLNTATAATEEANVNSVADTANPAAATDVTKEANTPVAEPDIVVTQTVQTNNLSQTEVKRDVISPNNVLKARIRVYCDKMKPGAGLSRDEMRRQQVELVSIVDSILSNGETSFASAIGVLIETFKTEPAMQERYILREMRGLVSSGVITAQKLVQLENIIDVVRRSAKGERNISKSVGMAQLAGLFINPEQGSKFCNYFASR